MNKSFTLGVNYWPRNKAMYWWREFDSTEVQTDFAIIQELGMNVVRIFLLWDDFQPEPDCVSKNALANLCIVANIAQEYSLGLDITFFTGHMSGPNWCPRWLVGGELPPHEHKVWLHDVVSDTKPVHSGYRNMYHDEIALKASRILVETVVGALKDHPAVEMWNLGNEPDLFAWPDSSLEGAKWVGLMVELIKSIDPIHPVTIGLHGDSLFRDNGFRVDMVYAQTDVAVMHSYPMYSQLARHSLDPDYVPFTCALTAALCGKPVLMEEFGGCTTSIGEKSFILKWKETNGFEREQFMTNEDDLAEYIRLSLPKLQESGATGAILWCFADYEESLWNRPPCENAVHERSFGLIRADGSLKPHAKVIQEFAKTNPLVQAIPEFAQIAIDPEKFYGDPEGYVSDELLEKLYETYLQGLARVL